MDMQSLLGPAVVAACVSGMITVVGMIVSARTARKLHTERLNFEEKAIDRKNLFDNDLAERRFSFDCELHVHKRKLDFAENIYADFLKIRDLIYDLRHPGALPSEAEGRAREEGETEDLSRTLDTYYVPYRRLHDARGVIMDLYSKRHQCQALLGGDTKPAFDAVIEAVDSVKAAATTLMQMTRRGADRMERNQALSLQLEANIWRGMSDPDPIQSRLDAAVLAIETVCVPILRELPAPRRPTPAEAGAGIFSDLRQE